jgi:hypothetical protein
MATVPKEGVTYEDEALSENIIITKLGPETKGLTKNGNEMTTWEGTEITLDGTPMTGKLTLVRGLEFTANGGGVRLSNMTPVSSGGRRRRTRRRHHRKSRRSRK